MFVRVDFESAVPLFQQIVHQIMRGIVLGQLTAGQKLPSIRRLGTDLGVNLHTVRKAYVQLERDGWITMQDKKVALISDKAQVQRDAASALATALTEPLQQAHSAGISREIAQLIFTEQWESAGT